MRMSPEEREARRRHWREMVDIAEALVHQAESEEELAEKYNNDYVVQDLHIAKAEAYRSSATRVLGALAYTNPTKITPAPRPEEEF